MNISRAVLVAGALVIASWLVFIPVSVVPPDSPPAERGSHVLGDRFSPRSAYAQEAFSADDTAKRLESRRRHTREKAVAELARQGKQALAWMEKVLLSRVNRYRLRLGVIEALNRMVDIRADDLSRSAIAALIHDTAHYNHALRRESRRFLVKHAGEKVEKIFDQILEEVRETSHPGRSALFHAGLIARTGLDLLFERGMREIARYAGAREEDRRHLQNGIAAFQKAWGLRSIASARNRYLFPKALYGWGYALEERAWIERGPSAPPRPGLVRAAQDKYKEFMDRVLHEDPRQEYPYREHLYQADLYRESPKVRGTLNALAWRALSLSATFESSHPEPENFAALAGDFDGQGMSFGALQWNLGQRTLQPLFKKINRQHPQLVRNIFGQDYSTLIQTLQQSRKEQLQWVRSIQNLRHFTIDEPWRGFFKALAGRYAFQNIQVQHAERLFRDAIKLCQEYSLRSERCVALMFDIKVQDGGIHRSIRAKIKRDFQALKTAENPALEEVARLRVIANRVAEAASPRWVEDVRRRKLVVANGEGVLHGIHYDLDERGITLYDYRTHKPLGTAAR